MDLLISGGALLLTAVGSVGLFVVVTRVDQAKADTKQDAILKTQDSILEKQDVILAKMAIYGEDIAVLKVRADHMEGRIKNVNA